MSWPVYSIIYSIIKENILDNIGGKVPGLNLSVYSNHTKAPEWVAPVKFDV